MKIKFSNHARLKFKLLREHNFVITEKQVKEVVAKPDKTEQGRKGRMIAQKVINKEHVLRVIYEVRQGEYEIITFYPGRRRRYEDKL